MSARGRVFIVSDFAPPSPRGRAEKIETRLRVFKEAGVDVKVFVPYSAEAAQNRPEGVIDIRYPLCKVFPSDKSTKLTRVFTKFGFPHPKFLWIISLLRFLKRLKAGEGDVVLTMSNPVSNHVAGLLIKRLLKVSWVTDFRDPWVPYALGNRKPLRLHKFLEESVVKQTDMIVVYRGYQMSENYFEETYNSPLQRVFRYGYVGFDGSKLVESWTPMIANLVYAGSFYPPHVTPAPLLRGLREYLNRSGSKDITIEFYGHWEADWYAWIEEANLSANIKIHGYVRHDVVTNALRSCLGAIVIVPELESEMDSVPSKVGDYIGAGTPILAVCPPDSALALLVDKRKLGVVSNEGNVADAIGKIVDFVPDSDYFARVEGFDRESNEMKLALALTSLLR